MSGFRSWHSYWEFAQSTRLQNRYIRDSITEEFLDTVLATSKKREKQIMKGGYLWRSQLGYELYKPQAGRKKHDGEEPIPLAPERMKPLPHMASEGRANPKGIPYLYLATDKETAMAETRPWLGSEISVGQFKILQDLVVVDCSIHKEGFSFYFKEPSPEKRERAVWADIDRAFSTPVNPSDHRADYVPTQIIAELFKNDGASGILYKSALGSGLNVVLFDITIADIVNCFLYEASNISFEFKEIANPYFVRKRDN